jgi:hypothetical protein
MKDSGRSFKVAKVLAGLACLAIGLSDIIVLMSFKKILGPGAYLRLPAVIPLLVFAFCCNSVAEPKHEQELRQVEQQMK